jgi:hypothetical protein
MGANGSDNPEHAVKLADFWIYSTKVTNQQFAECVALGKCIAPNLDDNPNYGDNNRANDPVVGVTYDQAAAYCSFVHGRLPTEAEWEKSARTPDGSIYPWGDAAPSCDLTNFNGCIGGASNVVNYPKGTSYYGALQMAGGVFEWVADWYAPDYYANSPADDPQGPSSGTNRSVRSSSFESTENEIPVTTRTSEDAQNHRPDLGFRCVIDDPTYFALSCQSPLVYASNDATQSPDACPTVDIKQAPYCAGKLALTNVKFVGPADATIDSKNCIPSDKPDLFTCQSPNTTVSIAANCKLDATGSPECPSGFTLKDNTCVASGNSGQCLSGSLNSAQQCCSTQDASVSTVCPVGTFYAKENNACLSYPAQEVVTASEDVLYARCVKVSSGGGGDGPGCQEPVGGCLSSVWIPSKCCCSFALDGSDCP